MLDTSRHPCFNVAVKGECGRVHLPVAAHCNIKCNYCNRKYDCVNESRPGVTSAVLSPFQAARYMEKIIEKEPRITVAGIAGPGDPFANPEETLETIRLVRKKFPHILLCLASNGLGLPAYLEEIAELQVSHVTITVNAVDPEIGQKIYSWVRDRKVIYRGFDGASLLLERQLASIKGLKERGITVKVNTIIVPSINDHHVEEVAKKMAELGVDVLNCMPMYPNRDTPFENLGEPSRELTDRIREKAERHLPQMRHCTRCRADAAGLLEKDRGKELLGSFLCGSKEESRPHVAVATMEGMLVNMHLGETHKFQIWTKTETGSFACIEERDAPEPGGGLGRWRDLARVLHDCRAVLVGGIGENPRKILSANGIQPIEMNGFIAMGLDVVYGGGRLEELKARRAGCCKSQGCGGDGEGC